MDYADVPLCVTCKNMHIPPPLMNLPLKCLRYYAGPLREWNPVTGWVDTTPVNSCRKERAGIPYPGKTDVCGPSGKYWEPK